MLLRAVLRPFVLSFAAVILPRLVLAGEPPRAVLLLSASDVDPGQVDRIAMALYAALGSAPYRLVESTAARSRAAELAAEGVERYGRLRVAEAVDLLSSAVAEAERTAGEGQSQEGLAVLHVHHAMALLLKGAESEGHLALDRSVAIEPGLSLDPALYAPWIRNAHAEAVRRNGARPRGRLRIEADAPGSQLVLDGRAIGPAPAQADDLSYGVHLVRAEAAGRLAAVARVELREPEMHLGLTLADDVASALHEIADAIAEGDPPALGRMRARTEAALALVVRIRPQDESLDLSATLRDTREPTAALHARTRVRADLSDLDRRVEALSAALSVLPETPAPQAPPSRPPPPVDRPSPLYARWWIWAIGGAAAIGAAVLVAFVAAPDPGYQPIVHLPR